MFGLRVALAQINPTVGDLQGNLGKILQFIARAKETKADLIIFPELAVTGYPPEDLLLKQKFVSDNLKIVSKIEKKVGHFGVVVGFVGSKKDGIYNSAAFIADGRTKLVCDKTILPNYGVFDEKRYFKSGKPSPVFNYKGVRIGINICEDIWNDEGPCTKQIKQGKADIIININASPYHVGKLHDRQRMLKQRTKRGRAHIIYLNMVGGQDELIFDGGSLAVDPKGKVVAMGHQFEEDLIIFDLPIKRKKGEIIDLKPPIMKLHTKHLSRDEEAYKALTLAVRDYVRKNKFGEVVIGLSGGIDSGLTACVAADAIGPDKVNCVFMPSEFTSERSRDDAIALAEKLKVNLMELPINSVYRAYVFELSEAFRGKKEGVAEENLQARIRGNLLMALSNKFGWLVLTTGNKSEMSVGYATLYGDMAGGYAVLKDIPKTLVYKLAAYRNKIKNVIPESMIGREPTAELKANQKDQDTLPPYDVLDPIIDMYVVDNRSHRQIVARGFDAGTVSRVIKMIDRSEYKRRQAPPGPKISHRAFGKDWRLPITNLYRKY
jgi:NAD+ synthase (glutamine-hydrolysing)